MECNKEEAQRAMKLAENKMQANDFVTAQKLGQKAQKLYPEIENISRLLTVCDIHCLSMVKLGGSEMDWYRILQIEQTADMAAIKKQYRKLAFLLHPDKNMFPGAEAAFKLIGEANRMLTDEMKRSLYDRKYRDLTKAIVRKPPQAQSNRKSYVRNQFGGMGNNFQNFSGPQNPGSNSQQQDHAFWTRCPYCSVTYQYSKVCLGTILMCHQCSKYYVANDIGTPAVPLGSFQGFQHQKEAQNQVPPKVPSQVKKGSSSRKKSSNMSTAPQATSEERNAAKPSGDSKMEGRENGDVQPKGQGVETPKPAKSKKTEFSKNSNKKRRKSIVESSDSDEDVIEENVGSSKVSDVHRRSSRQKQNVSYKEKLSDDDDDDFVSPPKRSRVSKSASSREGEVSEETAKGDFSAGPGVTVNGHNDFKPNSSSPCKENLPTKKSSKTSGSDTKENEDISDRHNGQRQKSTTDDGSELESDEASDQETFIFPDPDFSDFDKYKAESCFAADQIWAMYDPEDSMPRFYARIREVCFPEFKLKITWLEAKPDKKAEVDWCNEELPVACGKYKLGGSQTADRDMFSHQMHCIKGRGRTYLVYPRKGETWAIFQNWNINWSSDPEKHKPFKFDFVEVMSDFDEENGAGVAYLGRVKGFVSLFQRAEQNGEVSFQISSDDRYRFSHRIPSFQMTGEEREGVPKGSYEFDPAALPQSFFESSDNCNAKTGDRSNDPVDHVFCPDSQKSKVEHVASGQGISQSLKHEKTNSKREFPIPPNTNCQINGSEGVDVNSMKNKRDHGNLTPLKRRAKVSETGENTPEKQENTEGQIGGTEGVDVDSLKNEMNRRNRTPSKQSATASQTDEKNTPKKQENHHETDAIKLRRSPRDLSKKNSNVIQSENVENSGASSDNKPNPHPSTGAATTHPTGKGQCYENPAKSLASEPSGHTSPRLSEAESFDFTQLTSKDKFKLGQVWALRANGEMFPKTYGHVKRIESTPEFQVYLTLLEPCLQPKEATQKVCCGAFKARRVKAEAFSLTQFSHCAIATPSSKKEFEIYPRKGEIWALYGNQVTGSASPNPSATEYNVVEVVEDDGQCTKVVVLSRHGRSKAVFKAPRIESSIDIPRAELSRFSHRIPAFSGLGGCWKLDPVSTPGGVICLD